MVTRKGLLMVAGAGICWATTGLFGTLLFREGIDPVNVASTRNALAALIFLLYLVITQPQLLRLDKNQLLILLPGSLVGVTLFNLFYLNAIDEAGMSTAVVLLYTSPVFAVLLSRLFLKEPLTLHKVASLGLAFGGVILVVEAFELSALIDNYTGILLGLASGVSFALLSVFGKHLTGSLDRLTASFYLLFLGALFLSFIRAPWNGLVEAAASPGLLAALAAMVIISTFLSHFLYLYGLSYLQAGRASIAVSVEPAAAILLAFIFLGEQLSLLQYAGVLLVLAAVFLLRLERDSDSGD